VDVWIGVISLSEIDMTMHDDTLRTHESLRVHQEMFISIVSHTHIIHPIFRVLLMSSMLLYVHQKEWTTTGRTKIFVIFTKSDILREKCAYYGTERMVHLIQRIWPHYNGNITQPFHQH
jgi:hypothetical protein